MKKYTYSAKKSDMDEKWWLVDAEGAVLGRLATQIAARLRGKHNPMFTPHTDTGDSVVVVNAEKIVLTGRKWDQKKYYRRSRWFGSLKETSAKHMKEEDPNYIIRHAVRGMLPQNKLAERLITKLKVYDGAEHPHQSQKPQAMS